MEIEREIVLPVPREEAWEALTEPEQLEEWFANDVELDPRPGGEGVFDWDDGEVRRAVVETVEEEERLVLRWDDDGVSSSSSPSTRTGRASTSARRLPSGASRSSSMRAPRGRARPRRRGLRGARRPEPALPRRAARAPRARHADGARRRAADHAPGRREAPRDPRAGWARPRHARGPQHRLPAGSRARCETRARGSSASASGGTRASPRSRGTSLHPKGQTCPINRRRSRGCLRADRGVRGPLSATEEVPCSISRRSSSSRTASSRSSRS